MNCLKRTIALFLALFLLLSVSACGSDEGANRGKADPTQSATPTGTEEKDYIAEYNLLRENYTKEVAGLAPDDVLYTVNGEGVTAEEVLYQFTNLCLYLNSQSMTTGMMLDLSMDIGDGTTLGQYMLNQAVDTAIQQVILMQKAKEHDVTCTEAQLKELEDAIASYKETYGEVGYAELLAMSGVSEELFRKLNQVEYLVANLTDLLAPEPSEADLDMYIDVSDTLAAKHILLFTVKEGEDGKFYLTGSGEEATTPEGEPYTGTAEEINAAALAQMQDLLKQIREAADPIAKFDELMHKYSRDPGLATNPDGYTFTAGQMVESFENTTRELEYNAISDVIESPHGYHIILRLRPDVRDAYISDYMNLQASAWMSELELEKAELFDTLDPVEMFKLYSEYQQKVYSVESES